MQQGTRYRRADEEEAKHYRKRRAKKTYGIEWRYTEEAFKRLRPRAENTWNRHRLYETEKQRDEALKSLTSSPQWGMNFYEYRAAE